jgi:Spy/CpxP family protein refolding chaperone
MKTMFRSTLILALMALPLAAQPGPDNHPRAERVGRDLQLTEAQKTSIRAVRDKHRSDLVQRRDAVQHARIDLRSALQDPATPESRLRALYDKASSARFDMILARRSVRMEVQSILTPEQRAKAAEMRDHAHRGFASAGRG